MVIWTVDGDGGREGRVDVFTIFKRQIYGRTWRWSLLGGEGRIKDGS